jgi:DNA-binding response OmpR family regulator
MKILLLEDDLILSAELSTFLENSGFDVKKVYDGDLVLREVDQDIYDIYLLDINVPKLNGLKVCEIIRTHDQNVPIIMISAYGDLSNKKYAFSVLADDYLVKPFQFEELLLRINSLIRRKDIDAKFFDEIIKIEDLTINKTEQKVFRNNQEISLTVKELQLLVFLAEAKGRTVSKQQITEHVWEHNLIPIPIRLKFILIFCAKKSIKISM